MAIFTSFWPLPNSGEHRYIPKIFGCLKFCIGLHWMGLNGVTFWNLFWKAKNVNAASDFPSIFSMYLVCSLASHAFYYCSGHLISLSHTAVCKYLRFLLKDRRSFHYLKPHLHFKPFRTNFKIWLHPIQSNLIQNFKQQTICLVMMLVSVCRN